MLEYLMCTLHETLSRRRGRARGRARKEADAQGASVRRPGLQRVQVQQNPAARLVQQAPAARLVQQAPAARPPQQVPVGQDTQQATSTIRPDPEQRIGRGSERVGYRRDTQPREGLSQKMNELAIAGGSRDATFAGRGAIRGRRVIPTENLSTRPKTLITKNGITGKHVRLQANYFKMLTTTDWRLYQYRVDLSPEEDRKVVRKGLVQLHKETLGAYMFDGTVMYTNNRLPQPLELFSTRKSDGAQIKIDIRLVGDMVQGDHHYLQFFNIIMRKCLGHLNLQLVGRNFYDADAKIEVKQYKLELWPGYLTSIRQHERDILMCAEITHKVMRQQTLLDILEECHEKFPHDYKRQFSQRVIGLVVLTGYNNNTYRIDDIDFSTNPQSTFRLRDGEEISYLDYYKSRYQIKIKQNTQPMLVTRPKARERRAGQEELVYLVPELCRSTGLTEDMRSNFQLMKALAEHTRVGPDTRCRKLLQFNSRLRSEPKVTQDLQQWNLNLSENLVDVPGRQYEPEKIVFGRGVKSEAGQKADWTKEYTEFVRLLQRAAAGMRFQIGNPRFYQIADDRSSTYVEALEQIMSKANPQLIFCIVSNNRSDRYSAIKKKCCVDRPVPSQVLLQKNMFKGKGVVMSIATKIAVQLNCKIGGAPWTVDIPLKGLMVVGYDVCHDTNERGRDFGAMIASLNDTFSRYFSSVSGHNTGEELSNDLAIHLCKALHKYKEINHALPQRIIIYRDGVGEGQLPYVHDHEVGNLKSKLQEMYGMQQVLMAYIVVTKRINTRIFLNKTNPRPGTVVDDVITNPGRYDFFIISQSVQQGTVSPTFYNVIYDNVGLDADKIQRLTYKLAHIYYNWSGTVRVPAPCQYAHKLAFFVSQSLHRTPSEQLEDLLYFL